jgi:hypothetical protein
VQTILNEVRLGVTLALLDCASAKVQQLGGTAVNAVAIGMAKATGADGDQYVGADD